ncbi:amino acid ABC transporter permease [Desulfuromonas versatilis]|uniref:Amino acid ABC transporter permease n=1 Tax=Desulfuromonas versatilis TaxID=2802975 RepID=A0ABN6E0J2_9BACT|nr:amino acid ABC transporter permease [Desulfuromonas versatilis]BCR05835.1 amino acid ABC transporter permease [Desulfuromonas versatilis]
MFRKWIEKVWAQYLVLFGIAAVMVYYWGWVFDFGYDFDWSVLYTVNPTYGENLGLNLLSGLKLTLYITLVSSGAALLLGTLFGLGRLSHFKPLYWVSSAYVEFFRNTPLLIQLFFWYFAFPMALPEVARDWVFAHNFELWSATLGLSIYTGAFMAEVIRAGLQSIPKGLLEAAYSSGLSYFQALRTIILPLAFRAIIPPLGSEFLNNMKNSSLAMVVGVAELCWQSQQIESLTFKGFEATTAATLIYLALSLTISAILNMVNLRLQVVSPNQRTLGYRLADVFFWPFEMLWRALAHPVSLVLAPRSQSLRYSPLRAALRQVRLGLTKVLTLASKGAFMAAVVYLLYMTLSGLAGLKWQIAFDNLRTLLIWRFPQGDESELFMGLGGLSFSVLMALIAITVSFGIGLLVGLGRRAKNRILSLPCTLYIEVIRGTPLIMVIFWVYFFLPIFTGTYLNVFWSATIALTVFTGAYLAEIVRGGIQNIPPGQVEAALSTGLNYYRTMRYVVLPQALKQMIPAIVGQFIAIFKDTSLAYVIGVLELTFVAQGLNNRLMIYPFEIYCTVAILYFVCCYAMSILANRLEQRLSPEKVRLRM